MRLFSVKHPFILPNNLQSTQPISFHFSNRNRNPPTTETTTRRRTSEASTAVTMMRRERDVEAELNLPPGFRFHPTDEELVVHYLCRKVSYQHLPVPIIAEIDLYKFDPWQLPEKALFGTKEWYFFSPRDRKYPNGSRPNRSARSGYWKATGADKPIRPLGNGKHVGIKKALVFYSGKAPKGIKTNWIMHEYRLAEPNRASNKNGSLRLDGWVLCRIYNKKNNWEKIQHQKEESFLEGNINSAMAVEDTGSDSMRTTESDVENDPFEELDDPSVVVQGTPSLTAEAKQERMMKEEDNDWFTDLNLDDLARFEATPTPALDSAFPDYNYWGLTSPHLKTYQLDLPPF